jgi:hypothetical protein
VVTDSSESDLAESEAVELPPWGKGCPVVGDEPGEEGGAEEESGTGAEEAGADVGEAGAFAGGCAAAGG